MSEDFLIRSCAPTLAGIKTANLFACPYKNKAEVVDALCNLNRKLSRKGLRILPLRFSEDKALIYLYRPNLADSAVGVAFLPDLGHLQQDFSNPEPGAHRKGVKGQPLR